jgi:uncharacterized protein (TIGR00251 family)
MARINVKVIANSKQEKIEKIGDEYKIHLTAQREKGKANKKLVEMLAEYFKCKKSQVIIVVGERSTSKIIEISI